MLAQTPAYQTEEGGGSAVRKEVAEQQRTQREKKQSMLQTGERWDGRGR